MFWWDGDSQKFIYFEANPMGPMIHGMILQGGTLNCEWWVRSELMDAASLINIIWSICSLKTDILACKQDTNHFLGLHDFEPFPHTTTGTTWGCRSGKDGDLLWIQMPRMSQTGSVSPINNELRGILNQANTIADSKYFNICAASRRWFKRFVSEACPIAR